MVARIVALLLNIGVLCVPPSCFFSLFLFLLFFRWLRKLTCEGHICRCGCDAYLRVHVAVLSLLLLPSPYLSILSRLRGYTLHAGARARAHVSHPTHTCITPVFPFSPLQCLFVRLLDG